VPSIDVIRGDSDDSVSPSLELVDAGKAFLLTPSTERARSQHMDFVQSAEAVSVRHLVVLS
jgi:hypothetical protein